jgi:hypothetical protein
VLDHHVPALLHHIRSNVLVTAHFVDDSSYWLVEGKHLCAVIHLMPAHLNLKVELASLLEFPKVVVRLHVFKVIRSFNHAFWNFAVWFRLSRYLLCLENGGMSCVVPGLQAVFSRKFLRVGSDSQLRIFWVSIGIYRVLIFEPWIALITSVVVLARLYAWSFWCHTKSRLSEWFFMEVL